MQKKTSAAGLLTMTVALLLGFVLLPLPAAAISGSAAYGQKDPTYQADPVAISKLQQVEQPTEIILFHASWCADCQRELPRFAAVIEEVNNPNITVTGYEFNREKKDIFGKYKEYVVERIPSFVVLRDGQELGRITEKPQTTLEADLATLMADKP